MQLPYQAFNEPHTEGILIPNWLANYRQVIAQSRAANAIYSGADENRHVIYNDVMIYFLSDHLPVTPYVETIPALLDTATVQRRVVEDLRRSKPALVIGIPQRTDEPNLSSHDGHVTILDDVLNQNCVPDELVGDHTLRHCDWTDINAKQSH